MKKGKTIATVALTAPTVKKINAVKGKISNGFAKLSQQDVVEAVFKKSAEAIIEFVNKTHDVETSNEITRSRTRRRKVTQLDPARRKELRESLLQNGTVVVTSTKEAASLYNYFKSNGNKVTYSSKKRGGIVVKLS